MNIYMQLKGEHKELKNYLKQIEATSPRAAKKRDSLFEDFKLALLVHSKVEEAVFYSQLKSYKPLETNELEAENEHRVAGFLLEELNTMPKDNPEWMAKFMMLKEMLEHHIEEEEQEIFKKARRALSSELAEDLGNAMRDRSEVVKAALAPVHVRH